MINAGLSNLNNMKTKINELIKLLLNIHKELLELERQKYEDKYGKILNNNDYFNIVISHEDFKWLRALSELIALIDEEVEQKIINEDKIKELIIDLKQLLFAGSNVDFSKRYNLAISENEKVASLSAIIRKEIK